MIENQFLIDKVQVSYFLLDFGEFDNSTVYVYVVKLDDSNQTYEVTKMTLYP
jgi:hypothetical protein